MPPAEILYVGDNNDTIRRYDAHTGAHLDGPPTGASCQGCVRHSRSWRSIWSARHDLLLGGSPLLVINQNAGRPFSSAILRFNSQNGGLKKPIVPEQDPTDPNADPRVPFASRGTMVLWDKDVLFVPDRHRAELECPSNLPTGRVSVFTKNGDFIAELTADPHLVAPEQFHPEFIVLGPDGLLYVSSSLDPCTGLGGQVLRFDPETMAFKDVFINDLGGAGRLNRPARTSLRPGRREALHSGLSGQWPARAAGKHGRHPDLPCNHGRVPGQDRPLAGGPPATLVRGGARLRAGR